MTMFTCSRLYTEAMHMAFWQCMRLQQYISPLLTESPILMPAVKNLIASWFCIVFRT